MQDPPRRGFFGSVDKGDDPGCHGGAERGDLVEAHGRVEDRGGRRDRYGQARETVEVSSPASFATSNLGSER